MISDRVAIVYWHEKSDRKMRTYTRFFLLTLGMMTLLVTYVIRPCNQCKERYDGKTPIMDNYYNTKPIGFDKYAEKLKARHIDIETAHQNANDNAGFSNTMMKSKDPIREIPIDIVLDQFQKNALFTATSKDVSADLLQMPDLHYLHGMKNPCWLEPLIAADPYGQHSHLPHMMRRPHVLDDVLMKYAEMYNNSEHPYRMRCLPYVYILGVQKCGTSDLYERLVMHPDFFPCVNKELHWWDNLHMIPRNNLQTSENKFKQFLSLDEYINYFDEAACRISESVHTRGKEIKGIRITGEATPNTLWDNKHWRAYHGNSGLQEPRYLTPHFMYHVQPDVKFLITLRNPTSRLYSGYLYFSENPSLEQFHKWIVLIVKQFNTCVNEFSLRKCSHETYHAKNEMQLLKLRLRMGLYIVDIQEWMSVFPRENFKVVTLESRNKDPLGQMKDIFAFLEMDPVDVATEERIRRLNPVNANTRNNAASLGPMLNSTKAILDDFYKPYNKQLARLLNDQTFDW